MVLQIIYQGSTVYKQQIYCEMNALSYIFTLLFILNATSFQIQPDLPLQVNENSQQFETFLDLAKIQEQIKSPTQQFYQEPNTVGYTIGQVKSKSILRKSGQSTLYELHVDEMQDQRPYKLIQLVGTHYEVGYDYASLLGKQIVETYNLFFTSAGFTGFKRTLLEMFLDWQYSSYVSLQIPFCFKNQLKGIQEGGKKVHNISNLKLLFQRTLVVSSYPGDFGNDITYALLDQFLKDMAHIKNERIINYVQDHLFEVVKMIKHFMHVNKMYCSFFATWGQRTQGGKLYTMRNLDWNANTGINKNKVVFVWKIKDQIPHVTLGFPAMLGALTGMSKAGITVHEAGLDSMRQTELGFQWTLRLRFIMMRAKTLAEAKRIWEQTNNTLGMNHMIASAGDLATGEPVFVVETMRNYTAWFKDYDQRENGTVFTDPKTGQMFQAGFSMPHAVFRTNHGYDPFINKYRTVLPSLNDSTIRRYKVIKDTFLTYEKNNVKIQQREALNITANVAHKGGDNLYHCPPMGKDDGTNVLSVMFIPGDLRMYVGFEYGEGQKYHTACCGVYVHIDMKQFF